MDQTDREWRLAQPQSEWRLAQPGDFQNLAHYSAKPLQTIQSNLPCRGRNPFDCPADKPVGLWVSDDDQPNNWHSWCTDEQWGLERLKYRTPVYITPSAKILLLSSMKDIDLFQKTFGGVSPSSNLPPMPLIYKRLCLQGLIDWPAVGNLFQGILITPYCWEARLDINSTWYYGWDCASGCVWDKDAVSL